MVWNRFDPGLQFPPKVVNISAINRFSIDIFIVAIVPATNTMVLSVISITVVSSFKLHYSEGNWIQSIPGPGEGDMDIL